MRHVKIIGYDGNCFDGSTRFPQQTARLDYSKVTQILSRGRTRDGGKDASEVAHRKAGLCRHVLKTDLDDALLGCPIDGAPDGSQFLSILRARHAVLIHLSQNEPQERNPHRMGTERLRLAEPRRWPGACRRELDKVEFNQQRIITVGNNGKLERIPL
jgi:hypothetical protein